MKWSVQGSLNGTFGNAMAKTEISGAELIISVNYNAPSEFVANIRLEGNLRDKMHFDGRKFLDTKYLKAETLYDACIEAAAYTSGLMDILANDVRSMANDINTPDKSVFKGRDEDFTA
jgi:hypothetical protein